MQNPPAYARQWWGERASITWGSLEESVLSWHKPVGHISETNVTANTPRNVYFGWYDFNVL